MWFEEPNHTIKAFPYYIEWSFELNEIHIDKTNDNGRHWGYRDKILTDGYITQKQMIALCHEWMEKETLHCFMKSIF